MLAVVNVGDYVVLTPCLTTYMFSRTMLTDLGCKGKILRVQETFCSNKLHDELTGKIDRAEMPRF